MRALIHRNALRRRQPCYPWKICRIQTSPFHNHPPHQKEALDPRLKDVDELIKDQFATLRQDYQVPKHPIILAHGLLGFDELHLAGQNLPGIRYWYGITEALAARGVEVITATVPPSGSIEARAQRLAESIERKAGGKAVNIIGGLDSRYMISRLKPPNVSVRSLTTIATPHHGSAFADWMFKRIGPINIPKLYQALEFFGLESGAFQQLTMKYMADSFNPRTPDLEGVRYFSYGATLRPRFTSVFRKSHSVIQEAEGPNDGLVSVNSSRWGTYKGTLDDVSHLDQINWTNRLRWYIWTLSGHRRNFNAIAFYLDIAGELP
ncbi:lipase 2 [Recurvomyces mirabilis]|nr:lipase 2 [Recurvomyces mirabilis]